MTHLDAGDGDDVVVARDEPVGAQVPLNLLDGRDEVLVGVDLGEELGLAARQDVDEGVRQGVHDRRDVVRVRVLRAQGERERASAMGSRRLERDEGRGREREERTLLPRLSL